MTMYDQSTPRSRGMQRVSPAEATSRSFDVRSNSLAMLGVRGTPYYTDDNKVVGVDGASVQAEMALELHSSVSFYFKEAGGGVGTAGVTIEAQTQLGDYVILFEAVAVPDLRELRIYTNQRRVRATLTCAAGQTGTLYVGGE